MYYDTQTERYHATRDTLPVSRRQVQGLRVASQATLATVGIIPAITDAPLAGMVASGGYTVTVTNGIAHRIPNVITQAEADAIETQRIAKLAVDYGEDMLMLDMVMKKAGMAYPTAPAIVEATLKTLAASGNESAIVISLAIERQWEKLAVVETDLLAIWEIVKPVEAE